MSPHNRVNLVFESGEDENIFLEKEVIFFPIDFKFRQLFAISVCGSL